MPEESVSANPSPSGPRWQPIGAIDRRVLGVLAEKAKTTPDGYPMSLNAICVGCNQKTSRFPVMQLEPEDVEAALERLRSVGAVGMIEGLGRVVKYRHYLYEWLGVSKVEMAVMTELLLRGAQTIGELRSRAARLEPIADLDALRPILDSLKTKGLAVALTPEGRGQVIAHGLYQPRELEKVKAQSTGCGAAMSDAGEEAPPPTPATAFVPQQPLAAVQTRTAAAAMSLAEGVAEALQQNIDSLRSTVDALQAELQELSLRQQSTENELHTLKQSLGE